MAVVALGMGATVEDMVAVDKATVTAVEDMVAEDTVAAAVVMTTTTAAMDPLVEVVVVSLDFEYWWHL